MDYFERNSQLIQEISDLIKSRQLVLKKEELIGASYDAKFYSVGNYDSRITSARLFLGLKQYNSFDCSKAYSEMALTQVYGFVNYLKENFPNYLKMMPLFTAVLSDSSGYSGILTEDFSKGNKVSVQQVSIRNLPVLPYHEIFDIEIDCQRAWELEAEHMCFRVGREIKFGDFNSIFNRILNDVSSEMELVKQSTIIIDYKI